MADQIPLLEKALEVSPDNWPTRRYLIEYYASEGKVDEAAKFVTDAPEIPQDEAEQLFAAEVLAKSDPGAAQELLDEILRSNAACARAHVVKAAIQRLSGDTAKADSHIKVAQVLDPELDIEAAIADAVARPEAPAAELPSEVSQAVQLYTARVDLKAEDIAGEIAAAQDAESQDDDEPLVVVAAETEDAAPVGEQTVEAHAVEEVQEDELQLPPVPAAPMTAVPLSPPGTRSAPVEIKPAQAVDADPYAGSNLLPESAADDGVAVAEWSGDEHSGGERSFIVGEGEMVHAHQKEKDTTEKISAVAVAVLVHLALIFGAIAYIVSQPVKEPPTITVSSVASDNPDDLPNEKIVKRQQKATASVQQATPVVTVTSFSDVAVPEITSETDLSLVSIGNDVGTIGMSMTGLGDVSNMGSIPAAMRSRCSMSQRMARLRESGGEERAERAVRKALEYLASKQNKDTGAIGTEYPAAMTGLSLLAFLGHCETPESQKFGNSVIGAAQYLMGQSKKLDDWIYNGEKSGNHRSYEHGIATYALAELYTMTKESGREIPQLESILRRAVKLIVDGQTSAGGWLYSYAQSKDGDYSVAGWQIQALKAAYNTGKKFSGLERALDKAMAYTKEAQDPAGAIRYRLGDPKGKHTLAGAGILALQMWDQGGSAEAKLGLEFLDEHFKNPSPGNNFYTPYYNTQAYFMEGGKQWEAYNAVFQKKLLDAQNEDGSWLKEAGGSGHGPKKDNPIYQTALATLMLEVYYRYLPTTAKELDKL